MRADRARRAHRMAQSMLAQGVEQTLIASPYTIRYLTGCDVDAGERVNILLLHADGCMVWFVNALCAPKTCEDAALQTVRTRWRCLLECFVPEGWAWSMRCFPAFCWN